MGHRPGQALSVMKARRRQAARMEGEPAAATPQPTVAASAATPRHAGGSTWRSAVVFVLSSSFLIVDCCTDRFAANWDGADGADCAAVVLGCTDGASSNYEATANVDDGSCSSACLPDLAWTDSEGDGCAAYWQTYCGFEESETRCPTACGTYVNSDPSNGCDGHPGAAAGHGCGGGGLVCSTNVLPGCDGIPGSGETLDACGVCGGDGTACASCAAAADYFCQRSVAVNTAVGQGSTPACESYIEGLEGYGALYGAAVLQPHDCGDTYAAFELSGYEDEASCIAAQSQCDGESVAPTGTGPCTARQRELSDTSWGLHCSQAFGQTALLCGGGYSHQVAFSLANGLFGSASGVSGGCTPECVYSAADPAGTAWEWESSGSCWTAVSTSHDCLAGNAAATAAADLEAALCPLLAADVLELEAYVGTPELVTRQFAASSGAPTSAGGGSWLRSDGMRAVDTYDVCLGTATELTTSASDQRCYATNANVEADVTLCDAVVNDGTAATCTGAGTGSQCSYTPALEGGDAVSCEPTDSFEGYRPPSCPSGCTAGGDCVEGCTVGQDCASGCTGDGIKVVDAAVTDVVGSTAAWQVSDESTSGGYAWYYTSISKKALAGAFTCGWSLQTRLRIVSCETPSNFVILQAATKRFAFYFCLNAAGDGYVKTGAFGDYTFTSDGTGADAYHDFVFTYDPDVTAAGVLVSIDGSVLNADTPYAGGFPATRGVPNSLSFGASSSFGRSHLN
jgi:hypothetical protein